MPAYKGISGSAPTYLKALIQTSVTPRLLHSSKKHRPNSKLFSSMVPRWWNDLPSATRAGALYLQEALENSAFPRVPHFLFLSICLLML